MNLQEHESHDQRVSPCFLRQYLYSAGYLTNGGSFKEEMEWYLDMKDGIDPCQETSHRQRVCSQIKKVVGNLKLLNPKDFRSQDKQDLLYRCMRLDCALKQY